MTAFRSVLLGAAAALPLAACATVPSATETVTAPVVVAATPAAGQNEKLYALFERTDRESIARNPIAGFFRGDFTRADQLGPLFSLDAFAADRRAAEQALAELRTFDRGSLNATDRIAYDVFRFGQERIIAQTEPGILRYEANLPIDHFTGIHIFYPRLSSAGGQMPFATVTDYENALKRHAQFGPAVDRAIERFRAGMADGVVHPRIATETMIAQLDTQLDLDTGETPYWTPIAKFPEAIPAADRTRLTSEFRTAIEQGIRPALQRLRTFLATEYLPKSRNTVGLSAARGGADYYRYRVTEMTTLPLDPEAVHQLGLSEVARINAELAKARAEAGDRKPTIYRDKAALTEAWYDIGRKVDPLMNRLFARQPRTPLEIRPYEEYREKFNLAASYNPGDAATGKPGVFYFSGYDLANRTVSPTIALYMHEGNPGHHFQIMEAYENTALPAFLRYGGYTAFSEGWGLYAESLGYELGLYDDPIERIGALAGGELLRGVRLVVDTGLHAKGWSRQQAIDYMVANGQPREFATSEVNRYIVMPGQALAYKVGELKIKELRKRAETALGERFDVKAFHHQVLGTSGLPLGVLEAKIDTWIASGGPAAT
ncbi:DUF885 family protein [Altererythrobacter aerius]|uniref:DUF885 family protein n=1 Tax=Tsuneonella aeria TaxID=1837929 RepID=A0A6I4TCV9_9SPHN|nr:DUF885 family protein [Tsuneonella aeria]MXO74614.1 DUF885 family protein [Tsuneonella aeria]